MAVHKDCYAPIGLTQQGGPHRRETYCVLKLPGSAQGIPDRLLQQWSHQADLPGAEAIASTLEPRTREIVNGRKRYDHASDFLHVLLRDLELREH
nr:hypothetical protein [Bradyrhizobium sp. 30]